MKKSTIISMACAAVAVCSPLASNAQTVAADSVMQHARGSRLSVGGYGEVAYSRNFYSDSGNRYSSAKLHKNDPSHGRFDIPHAVIYLGYVSNAKEISSMRKNNTQYVKPYQSNQVFGSHAIATSVEVGYDIFSQIEKLRTARQKMYVFGHFEYYNSCLGGSKEYTSKKIFFV